MSHTVEVDGWDLPELERALKVKEFKAQRAALAKRFDRWGGDTMDDLFWLLFKASPQLVAAEDIDSGHVVGFVLVALLANNQVVQRLRAQTMRDVVGAALAAAKLAPQVARAGVNVESPEDAEALQALEDEAADSPGGQWLVDQRRGDLVRKATRAAEDALEGLERSVEVVADMEEEQARTAQLWGLAGGEMRRLSVQERMALAAQLDTERVRQISNLFGRLRTSMFASRVEVDGAGLEPVGVELGEDLERMIGAERVSMLNRKLFLSRLGDSALAQYAVRGEEETDRGGIVLCVDGSWSMAQPFQGYTREMWATALKLYLLRVALSEDRSLHIVDFGGTGQLRHHRFVDAEERTPLRALEAGSTWWGAGTDFVGPLRKAVEIMADENDRDSDVVFVSDGECQVSARTLQTYKRATRNRGVRTWGVQMGPQPGALPQFCDRVFTITDLTSGRELGDLLDVVESPRR